MTVLLVALAVVAYFAGFVLIARRWWPDNPWKTPVPFMWPLVVLLAVAASPWLIATRLVRVIPPGVTSDE